MAGLDSQMRNLNMSPQVMRYMSSSPSSNMKLAAGRPAVPLPVGSAANPGMVHIASPMLLEGRGSSRAGSTQIQPDVSNHSSLSMRSRSELNSSPMMVQAQSPHRSARESQQIQEYLMSVERNGQNQSRNQYPEVPISTPSHMSHSNIMQRNAIAQQLVQQSLNNSKAQYQMMNNQNNQNQKMNQQVARSQMQLSSQGQHIGQGHQTLQYSHARPSSGGSMSQSSNSPYNNSQTLPRNNAQTMPASQTSIQNTYSNQPSVPISQTMVQNQFAHQTLPSRNSPQMIQRLVQNSSQLSSRTVPYNEQITSQQQRPQTQNIQQSINSNQVLQNAMKSQTRGRHTL